MNAHVAAYFEFFHPALPILHRAAFDISSSPKILVNIVTVIGSLYAGQSSSMNYDLSISMKEAHDLWQGGLEELQRSVWNLIATGYLILTSHRYQANGENFEKHG